MIQLLYWLALATWFGSVLFIALAAPVIFRTVKENNPILSHVLSVNLDGQHSTLLAGTIVFNLISRLMRIELVCAGTLLICMVGQTFIISLAGNNGVSAIMRSVLFLGAAGVAFFDWQFVWPRISSSRSEYLEHADEPEIANPAKDRFDNEQRKSLNLLAVIISLLMGMILFSSSMGTFTIEMTEKVTK